MLKRVVVLSLLAAGLVAPMSIAASHQEQAGSEGYLGLRVADNAEGQLVVSWFFPGPFNGTGLNSGDFDIARPDVIVAVDGEAMTAEQFGEYIRSRPPGSKVSIEYCRAKQRGTSSIPGSVVVEDGVRQIEVTVDVRDAFVGTIGATQPARGGWIHEGARLLDPAETDTALGRAIAEHELAAALSTLTGYFRRTIESTSNHHMLSKVRALFHDPFQLPEVAVDAAALGGSLVNAPVTTALELAGRNIDVALAPIEGGRGGSGGSSPAGHASEILRDLQQETDEAFRGLDEQNALALQAIALLRVPGDTFYISGNDAKQHIGVIRSSMDVNYTRLFFAAHITKRFADVSWEVDEQAPAIELPQELAGAVEGEVIQVLKVPEVGWIVVGSHASNSYDMSRIACVIDPGGDDTYRASGLRIGNRAIIDLAGNDRYTGTPEQGPGGAILGVSFIDDRAGNDHYEGELLSCGAAIFGVSLLLDRGGHDVYSGNEWSLGAACYGAGMIVDLGAGNDTYLGEFLCQGVGGPRGFGAIIDDNGRDLYRANGPKSSAYGTPAVYQSFSQGVGFGYRNYAAGGVGLLSDLGGNDRYEAGEFAQGGAYYFALGVLHDAGGRDLYYGNRYGQGFGVHQAFGALVDDAGDDTYWSMTAASQGAGWDVGAGLLLDRAGSDTYQCDGLGQGGASMQAIGMLIDLDGVDRYVAGGGATQGQSGGNSYHFAETGAFSFSLLMDLSGDEDYYSRGRTNNGTESTGTRNDDNPENSGLHGIVIDE